MVVGSGCRGWVGVVVSGGCREWVGVAVGDGCGDWVGGAVGGGCRGSESVPVSVSNLLGQPVSTAAKPTRTADEQSRERAARIEHSWG